MTQADESGNGQARGAPVLDTNADGWPIGGGHMGELIRQYNWEKSPLGPIARWPQSMRSAVGMVLSSEFPTLTIWGPNRIQLYNDGYAPFCGSKHPKSLGQDFRVCWESVLPIVGEPSEDAFEGRSTYIENQRIFIDRSGLPEEGFFTYSYSPIRDATGQVTGVFCPVTETTQNILNERRTRILRDLSVSAAGAQTGLAALEAIARGLADANYDVPFMLLYLLDQEAAQVRLAASTGLAVDTPYSRAVYSEAEAEDPWQLWEVLRTGQPQDIARLEDRWGALAVGPYPEPVRAALVMPLIMPGAVRASGVIIGGVSTRLPLDEAYRAFFSVLATSISREYAAVRAFEQERARAQALAELDRAKTVFFSNVSHEFRTPLTLMLGPLEDELAERAAPLPPARRERLTTAHHNAQRLLKLVNTLLDVARMESGRAQALFVPTDLAAYTRELCGVFRSAIEHAGLTFTVDCPALPELVYVDRDMWEKIVLNLLSNAYKHTLEGSIRVRLSWQKDHVALVVQDTGVGIAQAELPRVFEGFYRLPVVRSRSHEGSGIGLALVRDVVAAHGGSVTVESQLGEGTVFQVSLPTGRAHLPPEQVASTAPSATLSSQVVAYIEEAKLWLPSESDAPPEPARPEEGRPHILLVDDNPDMRSYLKRLLQAHYMVSAACDGRQALALALKTRPDLVLSDIMMPELDGVDLLRCLRADPCTQTIPIILLSARAGEEAAVEGLDAGADDYLVKPFSARELLARVRTHIELSNLRRERALELERVNNELESFSVSVLHDLRAPLRVIAGFSKRLLNAAHSPLDERIKLDLTRIHTAAGRMNDLIDDLLDLAKASRRPLRRQQIALDELAQHVIEDLGQPSSESRADFEVQPGLRADGDPRLLRVVLENLLGNAVKFSQRRSDPLISFGKLAQPGPTPTFYVADNGVGFDMKSARKLFAPFSRLHTRREFEGTGIGLATVQRIVARHGGRIWAESRLGAGATFYFTLAGETPKPKLYPS